MITATTVTTIVATVISTPSTCTMLSRDISPLSFYRRFAYPSWARLNLKGDRPHATQADRYAAAVVYLRSELVAWLLKR